MHGKCIYVAAFDQNEMYLMFVAFIASGFAAALYASGKLYIYTNADLVNCCMVIGNKPLVNPCHS